MKSLGIARVKLQFLSFPDPIRPLDAQNVEQIKRIYRLEGCRQEQTEHYIPAIVNTESLAAATRQAKVSVYSLSSTISQLDFPEAPLHCAHGQHRIAAAIQFLPSDDQWWIVTLYSQDIKGDDVPQLRESFPNSKQYSDGEIFRQILRYQRLGQLEHEQHWWSMLSKSKSRDATQLFKHTQFVTVFNSMLDIAGLWPDIQLGTFNRLLTLGCDEEILRYMGHIQQFWLQLTDLKYIDYKTVQALKLRAPAIRRKIICTYTTTQWKDEYSVAPLISVI